MNHHWVKRNEFRLGDGAEVSIKYWTDPTTVRVAAFGTDGHQKSAAVYKADVDSSDAFTPQIQQSLIDSLANALEYDLINHPEIHIRTR
ncbi:MAG TPA: hypothetical protein VIU93_12375 [Gallionellaceae bacterium]